MLFTTRKLVRGKWKNKESKTNGGGGEIQDFSVYSGASGKGMIDLSFVHQEGRFAIEMTFEEAMVLSRRLSINAFWARRFKE